MKLRLYFDLKWDMWGLGTWLWVHHGFKFDIFLGPLWFCFTTMSMMYEKHKLFSIRIR